LEGQGSTTRLRAGPIAHAASADAVETLERGSIARWEMVEFAPYCQARSADGSVESLTYTDNPEVAAGAPTRVRFTRSPGASDVIGPVPAAGPRTMASSSQKERAIPGSV
jgi:hypothetical protein